MKTLRLLIVLAFAISGLQTGADQPLPPPKRPEVKSPSGQYLATIDPKKGVSVHSVKPGKTLWKAPHIWSRSVRLADDGEHLVTGYDGLNLIPRDYTTNLVLVTFWHKEKMIREVTVGELFPDTNSLRQTVSHYAWGHLGDISNSILSVIRTENKTVKFDVTTGKTAP